MTDIIINCSMLLCFSCVQVWVEQLCGRLLAHSVASYTNERHEQERQHQLCLRRMHNLTESLQVRLLAGNCRGLQEVMNAGCRNALCRYHTGVLGMEFVQVLRAQRTRSNLLQPTTNGTFKASI
jgi:hypothetical protein